jgi:hypothetical protein
MDEGMPDLQCDMEEDIKTPIRKHFPNNEEFFAKLLKMAEIG